MIWNALHLENYRTFVNLTKCELRPFTLFFGYNSAGKSALLRSLPLVASSLRGTSAPIDLTHPSARGGSFNDLLTRPPLGGSIRLSLTVELKESFASHDADMTAHWVVFEASDLRRQIIEEFEAVCSNGTSLKAIVDLGGDARKLGSSYQMTINNSPSSVNCGLQFQGLLPTAMLDRDTDDLILGIIQDLREKLAGTSTAVQWLSSVRAVPPRSQPYPGASPVSLLPNGEGALAALAYSEELRAEVSKWFEQHLNRRVVVVQMGEQFQIALETLTDTPLRIPITDVGEGLIQVLPVLVAAAMARTPSTNGARILAIEEPESHLHPGLHAALADRFCALAASPEPPQIILETHSEIFLSEMQIQIASGELDPARAIVYWVRSLEDGQAYLEPITFDDVGRPTLGCSLPRGVFSEDIAQAKKLLTLQQQRLAQ